jgi:preprotein translocase subunit SecA
MEDGLRALIVESAQASYGEKERLLGQELRLFEKRIMLDILDNLWKEHLAAMDYLRQGIHLRAYAQKQPKQEYKREAFELFESLLQDVKVEVVRFLSRVQFKADENAQALEDRRRAEAARNTMVFEKSDAPDESEADAPSAAQAAPFVRSGKKVGRNEPCPCGSGKKYKACHGRLG